MGCKVSIRISQNTFDGFKFEGMPHKVIVLQPAQISEPFSVHFELTQIAI